MRISDEYDYILPPYYPQIKKEDKKTWNKILDLLYPVEGIEPPFHSSDVTDKINYLKKSDDIYRWLRPKLFDYLYIILNPIQRFSSIESNEKRHFSGLHLNTVLPYLIENNREFLDEECIVPFFDIYLDFLEFWNLGFPSNITDEFFHFVNKYGDGGEWKIPSHINILKDGPEAYFKKNKIRRFFPFYDIPDAVMEVIQEDREDEDMYRIQIAKFEWSLFCDHLNHHTGNKNKIEEVLENAKYSFEWIYGSESLINWIKVFQYNLRSSSEDLETEIIPIVRRWLNEVLEFNKNHPLNNLRQSNSVAGDHNKSSNEKSQIVQIKIDDDKENDILLQDYDAVQIALLLYILQDYKKIKISGEGPKAFKTLIKGKSYNNIYQKFLLIEKFLNQKDKSISKKTLLDSLEKILSDDTLKELHDRTKSIYTKYR